MTVLLLHGSFVDEFLIEIVLPVLMFIGLYIWADRKSKREKAAKKAGATLTPITPTSPIKPITGPERQESAREGSER